MLLERIQAALTVVCGVALVSSWGAGFLGAGGSWGDGLAVLACLAGSVFALRQGWESVRGRVLDVNALMVLAATGAVVLGHLREAAVLLFLFSLSNTLETYALGRTKSAIEGLVKLRPAEAIVLEEGGERRVRVEEVSVGARVRVLPFEQVPLDGQVVGGETHVNQVAMTGEADPVPRGVGEFVLAGTQNLEGMLVVEVSRGIGDSALEQIVTLVREAQENRASGERVSQWFGQRYTVFVLVAFGLSLGVRLGLGEAWGTAAYASLTLLVALSPCALVISTPAATLSALAWAARNGILARGGAAIESAGLVDTLMVDKTGTLTIGKPVLAEVCVCQASASASKSVASKLVAGVGGRGCLEEGVCWHGGDMDAGSREVLAWAAGVEQYSTHPIAEALVVAARERGVEVPAAEEHEAVPGMGVRAVVGGVETRVGQLRFFAEMPDGFREHADRMRRKGMTVAVLERGGVYAALGLRDTPRAGVRETLCRLRRMGVGRVAMLTGDNAETAAVVAAEVGVDEVRAGLLPAEKELVLAEAGRAGRRVMYVGDGINDAPSLARAEVGVAMGGLGSDVALNAADIVLMDDRFERLPLVVGLGRRTNAVIRTNLVFAGVVIGVLTLGSFLAGWIWPGMEGGLLPWAVAGHEGSTLLVILNGLRLLGGPGRWAR